MKSEKNCLLDVLSTLNQRGHRTSTFLLRWNDIIVMFDLYLNYTGCRSSHQRCSIKEAVLKNFAIFSEKRPMLESFQNKVAGLRLATLSKKRFQHRCFPVSIFQDTYFEEHLRTAAPAGLLLEYCNDTFYNFQFTFFICNFATTRSWPWKYKF